MNRIKCFTITLALASFFTACKKEEMNSVTGQVQEQNMRKMPTAIPELLVKGAWEIERFSIGHKDHTGDFKNFTFKFFQDGTVKAYADMGGEKGEWKYAAADNPNTLMFVFKWGTTLAELNNNWHVSMANDQVVLLKFQNGSTGEILEFKKVVLPLGGE
ncbi:MAG TPA: hypothetical protein VI112_16735 [Bacteroidia bacterium]|jgi:hypothetical protein